MCQNLIRIRFTCSLSAVSSVVNFLQKPVLNNTSAWGCVWQKGWILVSLKKEMKWIVDEVFRYECTGHCSSLENPGEGGGWKECYNLIWMSLFLHQNFRILQNGPSGNRPGRDTVTLFPRLTLACLEMSSETMSGRPSCEAKCRGVTPCSDSALAEAPDCSRLLATSTWFCLDAMCSAV